MSEENTEVKVTEEQEVTKQNSTVPLLMVQPAQALCLKLVAILVPLQPAPLTQALSQLVLI